MALIITGENFSKLPSELVVPIRAYNGNTSINRDYHNIYILELREKTDKKLTFIYPITHTYPSIVRPLGHTYEGIYSPNQAPRQLLLTLP